jgi:hypothetical protein
VADANYSFIFVDIGGRGRDGDAGLFDRSSFGQRMDDATKSYQNGGLEIPFDNIIPGTNIRAPHVFLGDEAFPLKRHLMKPYRYHTATGAEDAYNYRLSRARRVVENSFGILTARWRVLANRMDVSVEAADNIVKSCVVLHNYLKATDAIDYKEPKYLPDRFVDYETNDGQIVQGTWRRELVDHESYSLRPLEIEENATRLQYMIRDRFKSYFSSGDGKLPWQDRYVQTGRY